jgi:hypothetical protein
MTSHKYMVICGPGEKGLITPLPFNCKGWGYLGGAYMGVLIYLGKAMVYA